MTMCIIAMAIKWTELPIIIQNVLCSHNLTLVAVTKRELQHS